MTLLGKKLDSAHLLGLLPRAFAVFRPHRMIGVVRVGIVDHLGWVVAVRASAHHEVVDRRQIGPVALAATIVGG